MGVSIALFKIILPGYIEYLHWSEIQDFQNSSKIQGEIGSHGDWRQSYKTWWAPIRNRKDNSET